MLIFAYARPVHLQRVLDCLRVNQIPLLYAFSDGPATPDKAPSVAQVREVLHSIDWCEITLYESEKNLGLGPSIVGGVNRVFEKHDSLIVFEDDIVCVPGTYAYLCAALHEYRDNPKVTCVTGWTHPSVTPQHPNEQPYFDGRAECWSWGTWCRAWKYMDSTAVELMQRCKARGIDPSRYGTDLPAMAALEAQNNTWATRWTYSNLLQGGLTLRPPHSMVEHIGFDAQATNATDSSDWGNPPLQDAPPLPVKWPTAVENPECQSLWQGSPAGRPQGYQRRSGRLRHAARSLLRRVLKR